MDIVIVKDLVIGFAAVLVAALTIWNFFQSPSKKNEGEIGTLRSEITLLRGEVAVECKTIDDKVDAIGGRVSTLETMLRSMPDQASQHRLELGISELRGDFRTLAERLGPIDNLSRRLQEVLLDKAKG
jgi:hypothetical protein